MLENNVFHKVFIAGLNLYKNCIWYSFQNNLCSKIALKAMINPDWVLENFRTMKIRILNYISTGAVIAKNQMPETNIIMRKMELFRSC